MRRAPGPSASADFGVAASGERWLNTEQVATFAAEATTAYRVGGSDAGWVERFGDDYLISHRTAAARTALAQGLDTWANATGACVSRVFARDLPRQPNERDAPELLTGAPQASRQTVVTECGMRFGIDFAGGYAAGLFVDQRHNRALVRKLKPRRLLNCFAYTCSFAVAAALGGGDTVNIDLSGRALERGRQNFRENDLDPARHQFRAEDVLDALPLLERHGERFDMIVLDPPTFSRGTRGRAFHVESDLEPLLFAALEFASPRAWILLSTNSTKLTDRDLERMARWALRTCRRTADLHREPPLADLAPDQAARTLWLNLR